MMLRFRLGLAALVLASGAFGCAQCDTCDDFPVPCAGGNCGAPAMAPTFAGGPVPVIAPTGSAEYMLPPDPSGVAVPPGTPVAPATPAGPFAPAAGAAPSTSTGAAPIPLTSITPPQPMSAGNAARPVR